MAGDPVSKSNGHKEPTAAVDRLAKLRPGGGIPPDAAAYLEARTEKFQKATSGRGKPNTYGHGKPPGSGK